MKIAVSKKGLLSVREQIKRQLRALIGAGELAPGQALPSAKDLASLLGVNRNTTAQVYQELAAEGWLETKVGSGTFVKKGLSVTKSPELDPIIDRALDRALDLGLSLDEIADRFIARLMARSIDLAERRVLVVECNHEALSQISTAVKEQVGAEVYGALIQDLEAHPGRVAKLTANKDLVVCGFNHLKELRRLAGDLPIEVLGVMFKPEVRIINELVRLPAGTRVGFTCVNQRSTETFFNEVALAGGGSLVRIMAGQDRPEELKAMIESCDVIFATNYVYDRVRELAGPGKRLVKVALSIDPANIDLIRERLARSRPAERDRERI